MNSFDELSMNDYLINLKQKIYKYLIFVILTITINVLVFVVYRLFFINDLEEYFYNGIPFFYIGIVFFTINLVQFIENLREFNGLKKIKLFCTNNNISLKNIEYWNNLDTIFTDKYIITTYNKQIIVIDYFNIKSIRKKGKLYDNARHSSSKYSGPIRYDYLIVSTKTEKDYTVFIEKNRIPYDFNYDNLIIKKITPMVLNHNSKIIEMEEEYWSNAIREIIIKKLDKK